MRTLKTERGDGTTLSLWSLICSVVNFITRVHAVVGLVVSYVYATAHRCHLLLLLCKYSRFQFPIKIVFVLMLGMLNMFFWLARAFYS